MIFNFVLYGLNYGLKSCFSMGVIGLTGDAFIMAKYANLFFLSFFSVINCILSDVFITVKTVFDQRFSLV